jgi:plastocyanin
MKTVSTCISLAVLTVTGLVASGCGQNPTSDRAAPSSTAATTGPAKSSGAPPQSGEPSSVPKRPVRTTKIEAPADSGVIAGWVLYQGSPPKPKAINFGPEKVCASLHPNSPPVYETLVINPNSTVKWTLVSLRGKVPGKYPPPSQPAVVDQVGCIFVPHVVTALAGQEIEFRNSDPFSHNIRGSPHRNLVFNSVFTAKSSTKVKFDEPEIGIPLKCDIHYWMSSYVHVLPNPFFAITGDDGSFVISGIPPGSYTLFAWHESLKSQTQSITVKAGEVKDVDFIFSGGG